MSSTPTNSDNPDQGATEKLTFGVINVEKKLNLTTKPVAFEKTLKSVAQQFCAAEGYEHIGEGLRTGEMSAPPRYNMEEFNEAYHIKHDKLIEETFGMDEDEWKKFRVTALSEVSKEYRKEIKGWNKRKKRAYYMLRLICEEEFITGMKGVAGYEDVTRKECPVEFAKIARMQAYRNGTSILDERASAVLCGRDLFKNYQRSSNNHDFVEKASTTRQICSSYGYDWLTPYSSMRDAIEKYKDGEITRKELDNIAKLEGDKNLARLLISNSKYSDMKDYMAKDAAGGKSKAYPDTIQEALQRMTVAEAQERRRRGEHNTSSNYVSTFTHQLSLSQLPKKIPHNYVLLDTRSSLNIFKSRKLLRNIVDDKVGVKIISNGGTMDVKRKGQLDVCSAMDVWYSPDAIGNILSFHEVSRLCKIEFDEGLFIVHWSENTKWKFSLSDKFGIYVLIQIAVMGYNQNTYWLIL